MTSSMSHSSSMFCADKNLQQLLDFARQELKLEVQFQGGVENALPLDCLLKNITLDSRQVSENDVFVAIQGGQRHGLEFLQQVIERKVGLIISDRQLDEAERCLINEAQQAVAIVVIEGVVDSLGLLANWFYDQPSQKIKVVGITGTNGKTSSAFFCAQLLKGLGQKVALMGTLGNGIFGDLKTTMNTTPDSIQVHRLMFEFVKQGCDWLVMEVSSHALCLGRVQGVQFQTVALTQVTRDHLDFHETEEAYREAKMRLFTEYESQHKVLNLADDVGQSVYQNLQAAQTQAVLLGYLPVNEDEKKPLSTQANVRVTEQSFDAKGIQLKVHLSTQNGELDDELSVPLMGQFNIENLLCAAAILLINGYNWQSIKAELEALQSVEGRIQVLRQKPTVIVDFAHTPDALQQVLSAIRAHLTESQGKLFAVFGCGGNRDQGKRPLMGQVAEKLADHIMLTSDNPRDENPESIIKDILTGLSKPQEAKIEIDRTAAINRMLNLASDEDIVLIAGKGHEQYQEVKGTKHPYSDAAVVNAWSK